MKIVKLIIIFLLSINIASHSKDIDIYGAVNAKSGLILRESGSILSKKIITVPYKSLIIILKKDGPHDVVNGVKGNWYNVEFNGKTGWAWSQFIDTNIKSKYHIKQYFEVTAQSSADIGFFIYENNTFEIRFFSYLSEPSKDNKTVYFTGSWEIENDYCLLTFDKKYFPKYLFINPEGKPYSDQIEIIDDFKFKYKQDLQSIKIWGLVCPLKQID